MKKKYFFFHFRAFVNNKSPRAGRHEGGAMMINLRKFPSLVSYFVCLQFLPPPLNNSKHFLFFAHHLNLYLSIDKQLETFKGKINSPHIFISIARRALRKAIQGVSSSVYACQGIKEQKKFPQNLF